MTAKMKSKPPVSSDKVMSMLQEDSAVVSYDLGMTIQVVPFEFERIDVGIGGKLKKSVDPTNWYKEADRFLSDILSTMKKEILGE